MTSKFQKVPVKCPSCKQPFLAQIYHIVDVADDDRLKWQLMSGKLNMATCPSCGMSGMLGMPFAYHDAEKGILFVFVPAESGLSGDDQQKLIGSLAQEVLNSLPPEKRKAYLLQPQTFLRLQPLVDAILAKDGVTPEMLATQKQRSALINDMLAVLDDDAKLKDLVEARRAELDYEFYATLTGTAEAAGDSDDVEFANQLLALRARLLRLTGAPAGAQPATAAEEEAALDEEMTREELLDRLIGAKDDQEFEALAVVGRPLIDYAFYLDIANRIEAAEKDNQPEEARQLSALRDRLLKLTAELDAEAEQAIKEASELLVQLVAAGDPERLIDEHIEELDDLFFYVLSSDINFMAQDKTPESQERLGRLNEIADLAASAVEKRMPPQVRLINQLLRAPDDVAAQAIMTRDSALVNAELVGAVDALIGQFTGAEQESILRRLEQVKTRIQARLGQTP